MANAAAPDAVLVRNALRVTFPSFVTIFSSVFMLSSPVVIFSQP
jgi:hypothetical protein